MAEGPHPRRAAHTIARWLDPPWRKARSPERRAGAWAALAASFTAYLFACLSLGPLAGASVTALYAIPCLVAGWAFGASGGLIVAMLTTPLQAWLFTSGLLPMEPSAAAPLLGLASAIAVGLSVGFARDLRERLRERSAELGESEDRYRQLVDNSPEGVLVHERGVLVFANPSLARLVGAPSAQALVGRTLVGLAPFEDREALAANFVFGHHASRAPRCVEARLQRADGAEVGVVMTTMPIHYRGTKANLVVVREAALVRAPTKLPTRSAAPTPA